MPTFQPLPFGDRPQWQEVLQRPYLEMDPERANRAAALYATRQAEGQSSLDTGLAALNAALKAQRDKALADYIAAHTPKGGGGGGGGRRGGSGGGSSTAALTPMGGDGSSWYDQMAAQYANQGAPPSPNFNVYPSTGYGPNSVYALHAPSVNASKMARTMPTSKLGPSYQKAGHLVGALPPKPKNPRSRVVLS